MGERGLSISRRLSNSKAAEEEEDRLSSLSDPLLTDILSRLPIKSAAATSVLSRRWRHLWTGVTRIKFDCENSSEKSKRFTAVVADILGKLTSPLLRVFHLRLEELFELYDSDVAESCFRHFCCRRIEQIIINTEVYNEDDEYYLFKVPACLFEAAQSLVVLDLSGMFKFEFLEEMDTADTVASVGFPNLKKLCLHRLVNLSPWLGTLIGSCPLLEHLDLVFDDIYDQHDSPHSSLNVSAPNLKLLNIEIHYPDETQCTKIFINAPNLMRITICDCLSCYYFVQNPTRLDTASITLSADPRYDYDHSAVGEDYLTQMAKFVAGLSSVRTLDIGVDRETNIYTHLMSVNHGLFPVFSNLECLQTSLNDIRISGWKDLLLMLQYFPNLKHLMVDMNKEPSMEDIIFVWTAPDSVPDCLISKLQTIEIRGLTGLPNEPLLLAYILSNATVLKKLQVYGCCDWYESREARLWNACNFCWSLFRLPRASTTCEIFFWSGHFKASSNDLNGHLKCEIFNLS